MPKTEKKDCVACGKEFEYEISELHDLGFPHRPDGAASIAVSVQYQTEGFPPDRPGNGGYSFWHTICSGCGVKFSDAARDPVVIQALVDLLGWYVRQGVDLKKAIDEIKKKALAQKR